MRKLLALLLLSTVAFARDPAPVRITNKLHDYRQFRSQGPPRIRVHIPTVSSSVSVAFPPGAYAYYKFEGNGTDAVAGTHNASAVGAPTFPAGIIGTGASDNGGTGTLSVGGGTPLVLGTTWSASVWYKGVAPPATIGGILTQAGYVGLHIGGYGYLTKLTFYNGAFNQGTNPYVVGAWNHLGATYDGSVIRWYLNGAPNGTTTVALTTWTPYEMLNSGGAAPLAGTMDELGVWTRVLSDTEMSNLYNGGAGITY